MWPARLNREKESAMEFRPKNALGPTASRRRFLSFRTTGRSFAWALALTAFGAAGCDDERSTLSDPDIPPAGADSEVIFGSTFATAGHLRLQNYVVEQVVRVRGTSQQLPVVIPSASGSGTIVLSEGLTPSRTEVEFVNFQDTDVERLFDSVVGTMVVELLQTAPGLRFTINPGEEPLLSLGTGPHALEITLDPNLGGGLTLLVSGTTRGTLAASDAAGLVGIVTETGTIRAEVLAQRVLIILTLANTFDYDGRVEGSFDRYPGGFYNAAYFDSGVPSSPFRMTFDGLGQSTYPYRGRTCSVDLTNVEAGNPCQNL